MTLSTMTQNSCIHFVFVVLVSIVLHAKGHGSMYEPPSRNSGGMSLLAPTCAGGACQWYSQGCSIGCAASQKFTTAEADCKTPAEPKLTFENDANLLQYKTDGHDEVKNRWPRRSRSIDGTPTTYFPWRYPGKAPVLDPCGVTAGGDKPGQRDPPPGPKAGVYASARDSASQKYAPELLDGTKWRIGSIVEVAWAIAANHGGGYQYRLCPADMQLTEECFQQNVLPFVGDKQWIQWGNGYDRSKRDELTAQRVGGDKVHPPNYNWTRNPIPGCKLPGSGREKRPCYGPAFTPAPRADRAWSYRGFEKGASNENGIFGYSGGHCMGNNTKAIEETGQDVKCSDSEYKDTLFDFGIVDLVKVPKNLKPGKYVLSFRWDCEQTKQIWNSCADVTLVSPEPTNFATKPFSGQRQCTPCWRGLCAHCQKCIDKKDGECADCWKPMKWWDGVDFWTPRAPHIQCLGEPGELLEAEDGGAGHWMPGDKLDTPWSPGCRKCWEHPETAQFQYRESWAGEPGVGYDSDAVVSDVEVTWLMAGSSAWTIIATVEFFLLLMATGAAAYLYVNKRSSFEEQRNDPVVPEMEISTESGRLP